MSYWSIMTRNSEEQMLVEEHGFELELDIIKYNEESNRVLINGFLGEELAVEYKDGVLVMTGTEGTFKVYIREEEMNGLGKRA